MRNKYPNIIRVLMVLVMAVALTGVLVAVPAGAQDCTNVTLSATSGPVGSPVTISVSDAAAWNGQPVTVKFDGMPMTVVMKEARCDLVSFAPSLLSEMASLDGAVPLCGTTLKRFSDPITPSAGQQAADVIDHIRRFIANNPLVAHEPLVADSTARYLVATILTAFPRKTLI